LGPKNKFGTCSDHHIGRKSKFSDFLNPEILTSFQLFPSVFPPFIFSTCSRRMWAKNMVCNGNFAEIGAPQPSKVGDFDLWPRNSTCGRASREHKKEIGKKDGKPKFKNRKI